MTSTSAVDGHATIHPVAWKDHHSANSVAEPKKALPIFERKLIDDVRNAGRAVKCWDDAVAGQFELADSGLVVQVDAGRRGCEMEHHTVRKRFAPESLVIPPEGWTARVRIGVRRGIRSEIEGDVNLIVRVHISNLQEPVLVRDRVRGKNLGDA